MTTAMPPGHTTPFNRHQMAAVLYCLANLAITPPDAVIPIPLIIGVLYLGCALRWPR